MSFTKEIVIESWNITHSSKSIDLTNQLLDAALKAKSLHAIFFCTEVYKDENLVNHLKSRFDQSLFHFFCTNLKM